MSRHSITVRSAIETDDEAIIGYDPPLRTYFLQAFEDPLTECLGLWLGARLEEYPSLPKLLEALVARGFSISDLSDDLIAEMRREETGPHAPSFAERSGRPLR